MGANDAADQEKKPVIETSGGCLSPGKLLPKLLFAALLTIVILAHLSPDLSRFEGRGEEDLSSPMAGEVGLEALKSMASPGNPPFRYEEANINRYLARLIKGRHQGWTGNHIDFEDIAIDLQEGAFEVLITRRFLGRFTNQTARFSIERSGDNILVRPRGGSLGRLPLPKRLPMIGKAAFAEVARVLAPEIGIFLTVERIDFFDGTAKVHPY